MVRARVGAHVDRILAELRRSFSEEYSPHQIAGSFALGVFITMLPTLGVGLLLFLVLIYLFDWINRVALFASVLVLNPVVKWGVYAGSMALGIALLGPITTAEGAHLSTTTGQAVLVRLLVGNTILAVIATIAAYVAIHRLAVRYQDTAQEVVEVVIEEVVEDTEPHHSDSVDAGGPTGSTDADQ